jgi:hypothetical protein
MQEMKKTYTYVYDYNYIIEDLSNPELKLIVSDFEPDDMLSILLFIKKYGKNDILVILLNRTDDKWNRIEKAKTFMKSLDAEERLIIPDNITQTVIKTLKELNPFLLVWLCDFSPLYEMYQTEKELCKKTNVAAYGSVNMRWCYNKPETDKTVFFEMINKGFESLSIVETFHAFGSINSANTDTTPILAAFFKGAENYRHSDFGPAIDYILESSRNWNLSIMNECLNEMDLAEFPSFLIDTIPEHKLILDKIIPISLNKDDPNHTNAKIIANVCKYQDFQMVFADFTFPVALDYNFKKRKCELDPQSGRFTILTEPEEDGTLFYLIGTDEVDFMKKMEKKCLSILLF